MNTLKTPSLGTCARPSRVGEKDEGRVMVEYDDDDVGLEAYWKGESEEEEGRSENREGREGKNENSVVGMRCV